MDFEADSTKETVMNKYQFWALCAEQLVSPEVALENDAVLAAIATRDDAEIKRVLAEEF